MVLRCATLRYWVDVPTIAEYVGLPRTTPLLEVVSMEPKQAQAKEAVRAPSAPGHRS